MSMHQNYIKLVMKSNIAPKEATSKLPEMPMLKEVVPPALWDLLVKVLLPGLLRDPDLGQDLAPRKEDLREFRDMVVTSRKVVTGGPNDGRSSPRRRAEESKLAEERPRDALGRFLPGGAARSMSPRSAERSPTKKSPAKRSFSEARSVAAQNRPRDALGRFLPMGSSGAKARSGSPRSAKARASSPRSYARLDKNGEVDRRSSPRRREQLSRLAESRPRDRFGRFLPAGSKARAARSSSPRSVGAARPAAKSQASSPRSRAAGNMDRRSSPQRRAQESRLAQDRPRDALGRFLPTKALEAKQRGRYRSAIQHKGNWRRGASKERGMWNKGKDAAQNKDTWKEDGDWNMGAWKGDGDWNKGAWSGNSDWNMGAWNKGSWKQDARRNKGDDDEGDFSSSRQMRTIY